MTSLSSRFVERLKEAGFQEVQAEAISEAFQETSGEAELATRRDLDRLEAKLDRLEMKLAGETTLIKWMLGILLGGIIALILKAFFPV